jgi:integrase
LPRKTARRHIYLNADDVAALADESGRHRALVLVLAYCGLRWGEAIGLRVREVEFLRRRLAVSENAVQFGVDHAVGPTKGRSPLGAGAEVRPRRVVCAVQGQGTQ